MINIFTNFQKSWLQSMMIVCFVTPKTTRITAYSVQNKAPREIKKRAFNSRTIEEVANIKFFCVLINHQPAFILYCINQIVVNDRQPNDLRSFSVWEEFPYLVVHEL